MSTHTGACHSGKQCTAVPTSHYLPTAKRTWQAMLVFIHPCNLVGEIPQTSERFQRNRQRSCGAETSLHLEKWVKDFSAHGVQAYPVFPYIRRSPFCEGKRSYSLYQAAPSSPLSSLALFHLRKIWPVSVAYDCFLKEIVCSSLLLHPQCPPLWRDVSVCTH